MLAYKPQLEPLARSLAVVKGIHRGGAESISLLTTCFKLARENNWLGCRQ